MDTLSAIYIEESVRDHPRTTAITQKFADHTPLITIDHYSALFKPKGQSFRLQKQAPALILAGKRHGFILPTPEGFGIGGSQNFYFSHMLNCPFDCRYCFLQGMFNSAHYVVFVNYEDYFTAIAEHSQAHPGAYYFSGYDGDSLAFESKTGFCHQALEAFASMPQARLELRTKSIAIGPLLARKPLEQAVVAFSLMPEIISRKVEHRTPPIQKRIRALHRLADQGWKVGIRLDPLIYDDHFDSLYRELLQVALSELPLDALHSISIGPMRWPQAMYKKIVKSYPDEPLLAHPFVVRKGLVSYDEERERMMTDSLRRLIADHLPSDFVNDRVFSCHNL